MAHMIDSLAWTGATPWHGLGRSLPKHATVDEMIRFGGLDWEVVPAPLFAKVGNAMVEVSDKVALTRSDRGTVLSVVGDDYGIIQNREIFGLAEAAVGAGNACAEVAGALAGGKRVFVVLSMREAFEVAGEALKPYLLFCGGHDGAMSVRGRFCATRVVCQNTLNIALDEQATEIVIRHTRKAHERVEAARQVIEAARNYFGVFHARALALAAQRISVPGFISVAEQLFPTYRNAAGENVTPHAQGKVVALFKGQAHTTDSRIAGTKWGAFNAVTALLDHNGRNTGKESRMSRTLTGADDAFRTKAFNMILAA